jgi:hypothetical protein
VNIIQPDTDRDRAGHGGHRAPLQARAGTGNGLLARSLALQAWSAAQLGDLATAIPAADEARRLARETKQPLVMATGEAVAALLAALRGDSDTAEVLAAQAEATCVPAGSSAVLAAVQLARGLAALSDGYPEQALGHLRRIHDRADPAYHQAISCFTIGDLAEAAARSGDPEAVRAYVQEIEAAALRTTSPWLHAGLRYARALLADHTAAGALFDAALRSDLSAMPFLRARVQLAHGGGCTGSGRTRRPGNPCAPRVRDSTLSACSRGQTGRASSCGRRGRRAVRGPPRHAIS